jgi:hypothetical protein
LCVEYPHNESEFLSDDKLIHFKFIMSNEKVDRDALIDVY